MIYTNGTILTLDEKQQVEAILVQDGRITCSGSLADVSLLLMMADL